MPEIKIFDALPEEEILAQMAEECVEASKAALKLRRARSGVNPTPVSEKDAFENLVEELADRRVGRHLPLQHRLLRRRTG